MAMRRLTVTNEIKQKIALIILDGWGYRKESKHNAIAEANTPHWDALVAQHDMSLLSASGRSVGLPKGQMGNSEVGHMHIGTGQVIEQDLVRINQGCESGELGQRLMARLKGKKPRTIHLVGLYSDGGVHAHASHWHALLAELQGYDVLLHPILDGRDTATKVALADIAKLDKQIQKNANHRLATLAGRFYAMDRDKRWERTDCYVDVLKETKATSQLSPLDYIRSSYKEQQTDEFILPASFIDFDIHPDDCIITLNFRPDRMIQLVERLRSLASVICMTDYGCDLPVIYENKTVDVCLGSIFEQEHLSQLRVAETEKFPHVTYFLNGGRRTPFEGEDRILIHSPKVKTYDLQPEMSASMVCDKIIEAMDQGVNGIFANFANADMVGHTGNFKATIQAIEALDDCLGKIIAASQVSGYQIIITADHGNAEWMKRPENGEIVTSHTCSAVPFITNTSHKLKAKGGLCDIAPTILDMLAINVPTQWHGKSLLKKPK